MILNGTTPLRRIGTSVPHQGTETQAGVRRIGTNDAFESAAQTTTSRAGQFQESVTNDGSRILRADTNTRTNAAHADAVTHTQQALGAVRETVAQAAARADATIQPGDAMSKDDAVAKVVEIYSAAFPGIGFTEGELAQAVQMLQSGKVTPEEMAARVQEGAKLINDPNAMADQAAQAVEEGRPNRRSIETQRLRMDRLATLMEMGFIPEGKFNLAGGFSYGGDGGAVQGQHLRGIGEQGATANGLRTAAAGLSRDMSRSFERYRANQKDAGSNVAGGEEDGGERLPNGMKRLGGKTLIQGRTSNEMSLANSTTAFGRESTNQVSLSGASSSSLKQASSELSQASSQTGSPVMLDLNHDGKLGVTGNSSAKDRADNKVNAKVDFDLDGDGKKERIEWMNGDGDGMLVDDRDGGATKASQGNGEIDGTRLFGDQGGKYANGYEKMKALDANGDGKLTGKELEGLKTWIDDGDAKLEAGELKTLAELGVTSINLKMELTANDRGEQLMRSTFTQNGVEHVTEDVWFAEQQAPSTTNIAAAAATVAEGASGRELAQMIARIDSTLEQLDNLAQQVDQAHSVTQLTGHAQTLLAHLGLRA